jgi:hypothetical protein
MADWVRAVSEETQTPVDLAANLALGTLSAAALRLGGVDCGPWTEPALGLYLLVAMPSGDRKSTVLRYATAPLREIERELQQESAPERRKLQDRREVLEKRVAHLSGKAAKADDADDRRETEAELSRETIELDEIGEPANPRLLADDATPEALASLLARHGQIAVLAAEAPLLDNLTGRYNEKGSANLHLVCSAYGGETAYVDRRGRDAETIERPLMAIALAVQPHVLEALVSHTIARRQGLVGRFGLVAPQSMLGARRIDAPRASADLHRQWAATVRAVFTANVATEPTQPGSGSSSVGSVALSLDAKYRPPSLSLSPAAATQLADLRRDQEPQLREGGALRELADWVARHPGRVARIAAVLHLAQGEPVGQPIADVTMAAALRIGEYLLAHASLAIFASREDLRRSLEWLTTWKGETVTQRDLHRHRLHAHGTAEQAAEHARELVQLGALQPLSSSQSASRLGRPPSPAYKINPQLRASALSPESQAASTAAVTDAPRLSEQALRARVRELSTMPEEQAEEAWAQLAARSDAGAAGPTDESEAERLLRKFPDVGETQ